MMFSGSKGRYVIRKRKEPRGTARDINCKYSTRLTAQRGMIVVEMAVAPSSWQYQ